MNSFNNEDGLAIDLGNSFIPFLPQAYVRPVQTDRGAAYGVYAADGTQLALFNSQDAAFYAARQHDLEPVLIH